MHGCGNHFIVVTHSNWIPYVTNAGLSEATLVANLCCLGNGVGADGLLVIRPNENGNSHPKGVDMRILNADGSEAEMCGNGARCAAAFAFHRGMSDGSPEFPLHTLAGVHDCRVHVSERSTPQQPVDGPSHTTLQKETMVTVTFPLSEPALRHLPPDFIRALPPCFECCRELIQGIYFVNTGVPHVVVILCRETSDIWWVTTDIADMGRFLRHHAAFCESNGANVDFIMPDLGRDEDDHSSQTIPRLKIRTYERGVEAETQACGTGCMAGATCYASYTGNPSEFAFQMQTRGGYTLICRTEGTSRRCSMSGPSVLVFEGVIEG